MNLRKVRVRMPKAQSGLEVKMKAGLGFNANQLSWPVMAGRFSEPELKERRTLGPTDWDNANLEAELGETAVTDLDGDGIPEHYNIGGKRHYDGGTPLNLPENSFIFSRDVTMKIRDKDILSQFGITSPPKGGMTPADVAKKFNINQYKKTLLDKNSDDLSRKTAEMMITNYNLMLGKLAMVQESMKGFPDGMPLIAMPYLESIGLDPEQFLPKQEELVDAGPYEEEEGVQQQEGEEEMGQPEEPAADMPMGRYGLNKYQKAGATKTVRTDWKVVKDGPNYVFVQTDVDTGKELQRTTTNPKSGDTRTAEQIYTANRNRGTTRTSVPLTPSQIDRDNDYRLGENNQYFNQMRDVLYGPNGEKIKTEMMAKYNAEIESLKSSGKLTDAEYNDLINKSPDEVLNIFMHYQKQNYAFRNDKAANFGANAGYYDQPGWDDGGVNALYEKTAKDLGFQDHEILRGTDVKAAQAVFRGLVGIQLDDENRANNDKILTGNGNRLMLISGKVSQGLPLNDRYGFISATDGSLGNNSAQQLMVATPMEEEKSPCLCDDGTTPERRPDGSCPCDPGDIPVDGDIPSKGDTPKSPWWLQDIIGLTGDFLDYGRIKKYMPWQAFPSVDFIEPTFYDPDRELAANAEQLAIGAGGLSNFSSPQSYVSRFSALSGQAGQNAADIMARYNALNVGVANEAEKYNTDIFNQYAEGRAEAATDLYDKLTKVNQQYDNSKMAARQKLRQSFINGITNSANAQMINMMYDNFAVDTTTGGRLKFIPGKGGINALQQRDQSSVESKAKQLMRENQGTGMTWDQAIRLAGGYNQKYYPDPRTMSYPGSYGTQQSQEEEE